MNKRIGLYWQHDLDLVALKMHPDFNIGYWMKRAVIAYARGDEGLVIPLPHEMPYRVEIDNCSTHFVLHPEKEADVIACLNGFRTGHVANAIKQIFRMYLEAPYLAPYYNDEMFAVKTRGRSSNKGTSQAVKPVAKKRVVTAPKSNSSRPVAPTPRPVTPKPTVEQPKVVKEEPIRVTEARTYEDNNKPNEINKAYEEPINEYSETVNSSSYDEPEPEVPSDDDGFDMFAAIDKMFQIKGER